MSRSDDPKVPKPPPMRAPSFPRIARPGRIQDSPDSTDESNAGDRGDDTWVAGGGDPDLRDQQTGEASLFDDRDGGADTNIDWNSPSAPMISHDPREHTLSFDRNTASGMPHDHGGDFATEPGFSSDGSLSALRDAMRSNPAASSRERSGDADVLPIPAPRALTNPGIRPLPPVRRPEEPIPQKVRPGHTAPIRRAPEPRRKRGKSPSSVLGPVLLAALIVLVVAAVALRAVLSPTQVVGNEPPMLPVVGGPAPKSAPPAPFDLTPPPPYTVPELASLSADLDEMPGRILEARAANNPPLVAAWSDKYLRATDNPSQFFEHAARLSEVGQTDAAFYWLARAIQESGVSPQWLVDRSEFRYLWVDPRWDAFIRWTIVSANYHASRGASPATIILPADLDAAAKAEAARNGTSVGPGAPSLPVVIWLDEIGGNGSSVLKWGQDLADATGVLVVGLGGPERIGPAGSWWTGDAERDRQHIDNALSAIPNARPNPQRIYAVGAGQGAQYLVELMLRDASFISEGLAFTPTDDWPGQRDKKAEGQRDRNQSIVLASGGLMPEVHTLIRVDSGRLMRSGVKFEMKISHDLWPGTTPADVDERITTWVSGLLGIQPSTEAEPAKASAN